jgi:hypothetical protein
MSGGDLPMGDLAAGQAPEDRYQLGPATVAQLARVAVAADRGPRAVPLLTGVLLDGHQVAATDDRRLAIATTAEDLPRLVLPARPLTRAARGGPKGLTLSLGNQTVQLQATTSSRSWTLTCLPAASYPDLTPHLDQLHPDEVVEVEAAALRDLVAPWTSRAPSLMLCPTDGGLRVAADDGTALATLAAKSTASRPLAVAPTLLLDLLATAASETVRLQLSRRPLPGAILLREDGFTHALLCCRPPTTEAAA